MWLQVPQEVHPGEACVRAGDVYALVAQTYAAQGAWPQAARMLDDMDARDISAATFLGLDTVKNVYSRAGLDMPASMQAAPGMHGDDAQDDAEIVSD
jgi:hypothetical protein